MNGEYFLETLAKDAFRILPYIPKENQLSINAAIALLARGVVYLSPEDRLAAVKTMVERSLTTEDGTETRSRLASVAYAVGNSLPIVERKDLHEFMKARMTSNRLMDANLVFLFNEISR